MFDLDRFQEIWVTITRNKFRSILTGFGVFWGIFMLVIMLGAGKGLQLGMMQGIDGFATNSCFFYDELTSEPYKGFKKGRKWNIRNQDIIAIKNSIKELDAISPTIWGPRGTNNVARDDKAGSFGVIGYYPDYLKIEQQRMKFGRFINEVDILHKRKVCVLGTDVYSELFKRGENPVGHYVRVNGIYYQVVGVSAGVSQISIGGRSSERVVIPFTTLQQISNYGDAVHMFGATAKKGYTAEELEKRIIEVLKIQHDIAPNDTKAVGSFNLQKEFRIFDYLFLGIGIIIWIVGLGTLFAGVIGVSNIMLVTVKERTREIGVRRALGAKPSVIMKQILSESLLLTAMAGILGLCFGVGILGAVGAGLEAAATEGHVFFGDPVVPFNTAIISTIVLLICGLLAGAIPAQRALQIKAIDAIREE
ncbi:MAG: ABC transporter permease [Dysgonamonadaceae bacterium]|nr:ABC transporter permease [Dysgonamonadaceae bacterium]